MGQIVNFETAHKAYIERLPLADTIKNTLYMIDRVTSNEDVEIKRSIPALLIVSPKGAGTLELETAYALILNENHVHSMYGSHPFLRLTLPKNGTDTDVRKFFKSAKNVAPLQNRLYGTFAISFEEYTGNDLLDSTNFSQLMQFVDENRDNIRFLFRIYPEFTKQSELMIELMKHINIQQITLEKPDYDIASNYIMQKLLLEGYQIRTQARNYLMKTVVEPLVKSQAYEGYISMNLLHTQIRYKMASHSESTVLTKQIVDELKKEMEQSILLKNGNVSIGFRA